MAMKVMPAPLNAVPILSREAFRTVSPLSNRCTVMTPTAAALAKSAADQPSSALAARHWETENAIWPS